MYLKLTLARFGACLLIVATLALAAVPGETFAANVVPVSQIVSPNPFTVTNYSWTKTWGGSNGSVMAKSVAVDASGNIFAAGEFSGTVNFDPAGPNPGATRASYNGTVDAFLIKFNANGQYQWVKTWGAGFTNNSCPNVDMGCGRDAANSVAVDTTGNAYVAGLYQNTVDFGNGHSATSNAPNGKNNIFVVRVSADGTTQWLKTWGGQTGGEAYTVAVDAARGYVYIEGDWSTSPNTGTVDFNPGGLNGLRQNHGFYDAFLSKYDLNGNFQWVRTWGGSQYDDGPGVAVDAAGNVFVCGMYGSQDINFDPAGGASGLGHPASDSSNMLLDVFLSKFDADGNFQWVRTWGGAGVEDSGAIAAVDHAGNVYATGRFSCTNCNFNVGASGPALPADLHSSQGAFDAFVSKFDTNGNFQWARTWGGAQIEMADALAVDDANDVYVGALVSGTTGGPLSRIVTSEAAFTKFAADGTHQWTKTWGGSGADEVWNLKVDEANNVYLVGSFQSSVDFDPGSGVDSHTAPGVQGAFLSKYENISVASRGIYLPMITR